MYAKPIALLACGLFLAAPLSVSAATSDYFLTFDGVSGASLDARHKGAIDIDSFTWGLRVAVSDPADPYPAPPVVSFSDFAWSQATDVSSPVLMVKAASAKILKNAVFELVTSGVNPFTYLTMTFTDVRLTSLNMAGTSMGASTTTGSFSYGTVALKVTPQKVDGTPGTSVTGTWNRYNNTGSLLTGSTVVT